MFNIGTIIFFKNFCFKNGSEPKSKFFVVLKTLDNSQILASLPSSINKVPNYDTTDHGCIELPQSNFNCFKISNKAPITDCNKSFEKDTFMYGHFIDIYEISVLIEIHNNQYYVWGQMKKIYFDSLILCFKNSGSVKRKFKNIL